MPLPIVGACIASLLLLILAALHLYWGFGGVWPAPTRRDLSSYVVGVPREVPMPGLVACLVVTILLVTASLLVLAGAKIIGLPLPDFMVVNGARMVALTFLLRGLYGFLDARVRPASVGLPFERLNRYLYSPLCLAIAGLTAAALLYS